MLRVNASGLGIAEVEALHDLDVVCLHAAAAFGVVLAEAAALQARELGVLPRHATGHLAVHGLEQVVPEGAIHLANCPGREPPFWVVKRPTRPTLAHTVPL